jgi:hypothetical protein
LPRFALRLAVGGPKDLAILSPDRLRKISA